MRRSWVGALGVGFTLLFTGSLFAQSIQTIAGGVIGDDRPATRASIILPTDVVVDGSDNVYIADTSQYRVRRIDARTGIITTIAGNGLTEFNGEGGPATRASFRFPVGIAVDSEGNVFIASERNRVLRVDSATGILTTVAGTGERGFGGDEGPATEALLAGPSAVAVDSAGNLYIADRLNDRVRRVDGSTGIMTTFVGTGSQGFSGDGGLATDARLNFSGNGFGINSGDVELDEEGNLYIADTNNQRVRRIDAATGIITTVAGGGNGGDGVPATAAQLTPPTDVAIDRDGNLFIADPFQDRARRVDGVTGIITTIAGGSASGFAGDGGPAVEAVFDSLNSVALDSDGNLYISDEQNNRIRRVDGSTSIVETIAGGFVGDGLVATEASFSSPDAVVVGPDEALYISDVTAHRVRRVDPTTNVIDTVAGNGIPDLSGDGGPATEASLSFPGPVTIDSRGNLYIGDLENVRIRRVDPDGTITTYAGGGASTAEGIPAVNASIGFTFGLDVDGLDNLYMAIIDEHKIRKVDAATGIITTVAGTGAEGFSGDGGPAAEARLNYPTDVAVDGMGNIYVADSENDRIRRVDAATGIITTILESPAEYLKADAKGFLYINEGLRIKRMDLASGEVVPVAGSGVFGYSGDGGPAIEADMEPTGIDTDEEGNLFIGDRGRIRAVFRCVELMRAEPQSPDADAFLSSLAPVLRWSAVEGAFSYDVYLDTDSSASALAAADVASTRVALSNLQPETTYHWRVVAKGDPYCTPFSEVSSVTRSFRTPPSCVPPPVPLLTAPAAGSSTSDEAIDLRWGRSSGATQYDVFFGTSTPPPFLRSTRGTSVEATGLVPGQTYYWSVVARAGCDSSITASSNVSSFTVSGECGPAVEPAIVSPGDGASGAPLGLDVEWAPSTGASSYDLFLGTEENPPLVTHMGTSTSARVSGLRPGTRYYWRVRANVDCDPSLSRFSSVVSFVTADECSAPQPVAFSSSAETTVGIGRTYVLEWERAERLGPLGSYLVQRATDSSFQTIVDSQQTAETSATFVADREGTIYHRVRPVSGCDPSIEVAFSPVRAFDVVSGDEPNVIFTVEPKSAVLSPGQRLEDLHETFVLENITEEPVEVSVTSARIDSIPFFSIRDPLGGDPESITLEPREPKTFELRFSGPPNDVVASYQGLIIVSTPDSPVASYAYVNLKVGDQGGAAPEIRFEGAQTGFAFFPGFGGDDASRPPITIEVHNPGSTPMDLSAEIGPQIWLEPESGWNSTPIPAGGTRPIRLYTRRKLAPNGSALPRYTFLTLRTRTGQNARLLLQDNDGLDTTLGRPAALDGSVRTIIVPEVVSEGGADRRVSKISLTNVSGDDVQADLIFTPEGADGFSESSVRSTVIVPANDVVVITDPLRQVFALDPPSRGQLEVRASAGSIGFLQVRSSVVRAGDVQDSLVVVPTVFRGDGARSGLRHRIAGISSSSEESTEVIVAETSGLDPVDVRVTLYDESGSLVEEKDVSLARYGYAPVPDLIPEGFTVGWAELTVLEGDGSAIGLANVLDALGRRGSALVSEPAGDVAAAKWRSGPGRIDPAESVTSVLVAPFVAKGKIDPGGSDWRTVMGFVAPPGGLEFSVTYTGSDGTTLERKVTIPASPLTGAVVELNDVLGQLFGIEESASGSITVTGDSSGRVYGRLVSGNLPAGTIELVSTISESVSSLQSRRPLYVDGLEQSTDPDRGTRWGLHVKEVGGQGGTVRIRLYEAGNRTSPIAEKVFSVGALQQLSLESLFGEMDLDSSARRKDRTNVLLVVTPESGGAGIVATAVEIDNRTGAPTTHALKPLSGGLGGGTSSLLAQPIVPEVEEPGRQRPVRRKE